MAYFGWPEAHENDVERDAPAGLAILDAVAKLNEDPAYLLGCWESRKGPIRLLRWTPRYGAGRSNLSAVQDHLTKGRWPVRRVGARWRVQRAINRSRRLVLGRSVIGDEGRREGTVETDRCVIRLIRQRFDPDGPGSRELF
jgi:hypothetical protein